MGDRANIFFRSGKEGIGVYAHWSGLAMAGAAMKVMKSKAFNARLGDAHYAMRIGVQLVLEALGAESKSEVGFGLWTPTTGPDDNEYRWIVVDVETGALYVSNDWKKTRPADRVAKPTLSEIRRRMLGEPKKRPKAKLPTRRK
jgi:hypothetical protein